MSTLVINSVRMSDDNEDIDEQPQRFSEEHDSSDLISNSPQALLQEKKIGNMKVFIHLIKASLGAGVIAMPHAVKNAGLITGSLGILGMSLIVIHCADLLIHCVNYLRRYYTRTQQLEGKDMGFAASCAHVIRDLAPSQLRGQLWISRVLQASILAGQFSFLSVCTQFIANNAKGLIETYTGQVTFDARLYMLIVFGVFSILVFVKTLHWMAYLNAVANTLGIGALFLALIYCFLHLRPYSELSMATDFVQFVGLFSTTLYAFEVITVLVPVENSMKEPDALPGMTGVLGLSLTVAAVMYVAIGFYGYSCFGNDMQGTIIDSMPFTPVYFMLAKPFYMVAIMLSYSIQFYVLFQIVWKFLLPRLLRRLSPTSLRLKLVEAAVRVGITSLAFVIAVAVPDLNLLIDIVGATTCSIMSIIVPAFMHCLVTWHDPEISPLRLKLIVVKDSLLMLIGLAVGCIGGYNSIKGIVDHYSQ